MRAMLYMWCTFPSFLVTCLHWASPALLIYVAKYGHVLYREDAMEKVQLRLQLIWSIHTTNELFHTTFCGATVHLLPTDE